MEFITKIVSRNKSIALVFGVLVIGVVGTMLLTPATANAAYDNTDYFDGGYYDNTDYFDNSYYDNTSYFDNGYYDNTDYFDGGYYDNTDYFDNGYYDNTSYFDNGYYDGTDYFDNCYDCWDTGYVPYDGTSYFDNCWDCWDTGVIYPDVIYGTTPVYQPTTYYPTPVGGGGGADYDFNTNYNDVDSDVDVDTDIDNDVDVDNNNYNDNDNDNNNNNVNENINNNDIDITFPDFNVNFPDIHYPDVTYPDIDIDIDTGSGGGNNYCGTWNNWCNPDPDPCGPWNNWCQPNNQVASVNLTADDTSLFSGESTTLRWNSSHVNSCFASNGWSGTKPTSGSQFTQNLFSTRTYTITCNGVGGQTVTDSVTVYVTGNQGGQASVNLTADQYSVASGQGTTLRWNSNNTSYCFASNGWSGTKSTSGQEPTGALYGSRTYTITCNGYNGQNVNDTVTVVVSGTNQTNNSVVTQAATSVTTNSGVINGLAINGVTSNTTVWFEWGTTGSLGSDTPRQTFGAVNGSRNFSWSLNGLSPNTTYYYRAVSETSRGVARGLILSFTTGTVLGDRVGPTTSANASIEKTVANLSNPNGTDERVTAWPGDDIRYRIEIENTGDVTLRNLVVEDVLPEGLIYVDGGDYDSDSREVTWNISSLGVNESRVVTLDVVVSDCACAIAKSNVDNIATVDNGQIREKTSAAATVMVSNNSLVLTLDADRNQVAPGDIVNFELVIENDGGEMLTDGIVRVVLPDTLTFRSADEAYNENGNVYTFDINALRVSREEVINIQTEVTDSVEAGERIQISAIATFEDSEGNQIITDIDEVINVSGSVAGAAAVGFAAFFPGSFLGWLLLIIVLAILFLVLRWIFGGSRKEKESTYVAPAPMGAAYGAPGYRTPSAYDQPINGNTGMGSNNANAFDHSNGNGNDPLGGYTNGNDNNFPNNLPR